MTYLKESTKEKTESIIAVVVNATMPSNDQMVTVRLLRKIIPELIDRITNERDEEIKEYIKNTLILLNIEHAGNLMKGEWINEEELLTFLSGKKHE